jgi:hypothetical protein
MAELTGISINQTGTQRTFPGCLLLNVTNRLRSGPPVYGRFSRTQVKITDRREQAEISGPDYSILIYLWSVSRPGL